MIENRALRLLPNEDKMYGKDYQDIWEDVFLSNVWLSYLTRLM